MRDVREEPAVQRAVDGACETWPRASEAWEAITWALARDPSGAGSALTESGDTRLMVFAGVRSIGMPSAKVVYLIEPTCVTIFDAVFADASYMDAGHA